MKRSPLEELHDILGSESFAKINIYDVGAAGGFNSKWDYEFVKFTGFEPDRIEYLKLLENSKKGEVHNYALHSAESKVIINICKKQQVSSIYKPNRKYLNQYPDSSRFDIIGKYECEAISLDLLMNGREERIDMLKIDTQGSELDILKGAEKTLKRIIAVEVETEFHEMYIGQPDFSKIHQFMIKSDFRLMNINPIEWCRNTDKNFGGKKELIFCDAIYFKDLAQIEDYHKGDLHVLKSQLIKTILISFNYGFIDYSYHILKTFNRLFTAEQFKMLDAFFEQFIRKEVKPSLLEKVLKTVYNKLSFL